MGPFNAGDDFVFDMRNDDGTIASDEDPYVWYHSNHQRFYVVMKDFTGKITKDRPGLAILSCEDGIKWTRPDDSFFMKKELILHSGDTINAMLLERAKLLIDKIGNPKVLNCACANTNVHPRRDGASFNVRIPLIAK
jgi:hypothetical protein